MAVAVEQQTLFAPTPGQLAAARALVVVSLGDRGFPLEDADVVAEDLVAHITRDPTRYANRLTSPEAHKTWFVKAALNVYATRLDEERRRRRREVYRLARALERGRLDAVVPDAKGLLALAAAAQVTRRQRAYLQGVFIDGLSVPEVAKLHGTRPSAVRAALQAAGVTLRHYLSRR